ncbi:MAG: glutaredoxin family protein [Pyrinomonadaceae bacterium]
MRTKPHVKFYTRPGCHLCEEAREQISAAGIAAEYTFEEVNIDTDPALRALYGWEIPVIVIDGVAVFKCRLSAAEFRREIRAASRA